MDSMIVAEDASLRAQLARRGSPFLSTKEAAFYLGLRPHTLVKMRLRQQGPKCRRHGRHVFYHIDELDDWSEKRCC
jgi:hypothetical protein